MNNSNQTVNEFILPVFMKRKKHDFKAWIILHKVIRKMNKISPDFTTMFRIWEMVNTFYECYMHTYNEQSNLHLFLGTSPKSNMFCMIYKEEGFMIKFALQNNNNRTISIEITRNNESSRSNTETISFSDGTYQLKDEADAEKFKFIISCLMNGAKELILHYYKNKRF